MQLGPGGGYELWNEHQGREQGTPSGSAERSTELREQAEPEAQRAEINERASAPAQPVPRSPSVRRDGEADADEQQAHAAHVPENPDRQGQPLLSPEPLEWNAARPPEPSPGLQRLQRLWARRGEGRQPRAPGEQDQRHSQQGLERARHRTRREDDGQGETEADGSGEPGARAGSETVVQVALGQAQLR